MSAVSHALRAALTGREKLDDVSARLDARRGVLQELLDLASEQPLDLLSLTPDQAEVLGLCVGYVALVKELHGLDQLVTRGQRIGTN